MQKKGGTFFCLCKKRFYLITVFFFWCLFTSSTLGQEPTLRINEVYPYPDSGEEEFVEIKNFGTTEINLRDWTIKDAGNHKYKITEDIFLGPDSVVFFRRNFYLNNTGTESVFLVDPSGEEKDGVLFENARKGFSWNLFSSGWNWNSPSPGEENPEEEEEEEEEEEDAVYSSQIRINEILPNPEKDENKNEYIELHNYSQETISLASWIIKDSSKNGTYIFPEETRIDPGEFLAIYRTDFNFALNNSDESVFLFNPKNELVSEISFKSSAPENASYNFLDEKSWFWSGFLTPGEENQFEDFPEYSISLPKNVFQKIYAEFGVESENKTLKFTWDFGDGKKSSQQEVRHKYEKTGDYKLKLKIKTPTQEKEEVFLLEVSKFKNKDIEMIAILPNPKGTDSKNEWIEIKNNGKKKINLKNWYIATGSEKLINHPIQEDFSIKPGKTKRLFQEVCAFSLGNQEGKIELRYPDGETAENVEYEKEKIEEEEVYQKTKSGWQWKKISADIKPSTETTKENIKKETEQETEEIETESNKSNPFQDFSQFWGMSSREEETKESKKEKYFQLLTKKNLNTKNIAFFQKNPPLLKIKNIYLFNHPNKQIHWLKIFRQKTNLFARKLFSV